VHKRSSSSAIRFALHVQMLLLLLLLAAAALYKDLVAGVVLLLLRLDQHRVSSIR